MPPVRGKGSLYDRVSATASPHQDCQPSIAKIAPSGHQANLSLFNLTCSTFVAQLAGSLDDMIGAPDMGFGQEAAVSIERQFAAQFEPPTAHEVLYLASLAKAHCLDLQHYDISEAVIHFHEIDIFMPDAGHRERLGRGEAEPNHKRIGARRDIISGIRMTFGHTGDI